MPERYCPTCSRRQPTDDDNRCVVCHTVLQPDVPGVCPRDAKGEHNAYRTSNGLYECSKCLAPMETPEDADVIRLGRVGRG